ncbi:MAG: aspartate kinase [Bacteroidetes bacterium]|nr:aspartate kinase [Bacteroidota bacterium]MCA6442108.1 aspartate kinase [Bacteroidota bacterium]
MQVFKFGGASVKDATAIKNVVKILQTFATEKTIVVISAMGKTTNKLELLAQAYFKGTDDLHLILDDLKSFHFNILEELFPDRSDKVFDEIENLFTEITWCLEEPISENYNYHYDQMVCMGELLSTKIVSAYLNYSGVENRWEDARNFVQTDNNYREGKVDYDLSQQLVNSQLIPLFSSVSLVVTQGFIGGTSENYTTTLGREGSDYTAALLAYFTNAKQVTIWKDVEGVLNADPKYFKNTSKIDELTYHDAIELTYFGTSVIHPKTIKPLQNKNILLYVKSFIHPQAPGTVIKKSVNRVNVTSYIFKENQILISIQPKDFSFIAEDNMGEIFNALGKFKVHANMIQNSAISLSICVDNDPFKLDPLISSLQQSFKVLYNKNVQLMTIRNYNQEIINSLSEGKIVLLEQRTRNTHQMVLQDETSD